MTADKQKERWRKATAKRRLKSEVKAQEKEYRKANREREKERVYALRSTPKGWAKHIFRLIKNRAKSLNREFSLVEEDLIPPKLCPVFGIKLTLSRNLTHSRNFRKSDHADLASVDRIDSSKGYTKENIRIISLRANLLKSDATLYELERLVEYLKGV